MTLLRTVGQIIDDLSKLDRDTPVVVHAGDGMYRTIDARGRELSTYTFGINASGDRNRPHLLMADTAQDAAVDFVVCYLL